MRGGREGDGSSDDVWACCWFQEADEGFKMAPSNFVPTIGEGAQKYGSE